MNFRKIALALSTTALASTIAFAQIPGPGFGGGPNGQGGPGGWKHHDWNQQNWGDNNPWNDKQTDRLRRMMKEIAQTIDENSDYLGKFEQFEIAKRLMDLKMYVDSVTPNDPQPPPMGPTEPNGQVEVVGQIIAAVANNPNPQSQWIEVQLNGGSNSVDFVQISAQQLQMSGGKPAFVRIYEVRASQTTIGGKSVGIGNNTQVIDVFPQSAPTIIPLDLGPKKADKIWVRAEAMAGKFSIGITVLDRKGFGGGGGFPGGFPGGGIGGKPHHMGKPNVGIN